MGIAVRIQRRRAGMSQTELGQACGVSFQQIQKYENGANRISFSRLVQLASALNCSVRNLVQALDVETEDPAAAAAALQLLKAPGAVEVLELFSLLPEPGRTGLLALLASLTPSDSDTIAP